MIGLDHVLEARGLVLLANQTDGDSFGAVAARSAYPMQIGLGIAWQIHVDDEVHVLSIYASCGLKA